MCTSLQNINPATEQTYPKCSSFSRQSKRPLEVIPSYLLYIKYQSQTMSLRNKESVTNDILANLQDPEFCDVRIEATDGEIPANKTILVMRSHYFRSMFSANNNFVESQVGSVKLPYAKAVLEKVVIYLYSAEMEFQDLDLRPLLDLMELLNLLNLSIEFSTVGSFAMENIRGGKFSFSACLKSLDDCSKLGLKSVGETLLAYLGENFVTIAEMGEVGALSEPMIIRLLEEKSEERKETIHRLNILATWLSVNSMDPQVRLRWSDLVVVHI